MRQDAWEKYNRGLPTKIELEIAQPQNLAVIEGDVGSVIESTRKLAEVTHGPVVRIEISMGRRKGSLAKDTVDSVLSYFTQGAGGSEDVRKLNCTSANEEGAEIINFLNDLLRESREVDVPEGDPDRHYEKRAQWLTACFRAHFSYIAEVYGVSNVDMG